MQRWLILFSVLPLLVASCGGSGSSPTETPAETSGLPRPVIFVPGVAGSQLLVDGQEDWAAVGKQIFSASDDFLVELALPDNGIPTNGSTHGDILRTESIEIHGLPVKDADFYATIINRFEGVGHKENDSLFIFPYDWRIDINTESERLKSFIDEVLDKTDADKVDIVAHSMGGQVTLDALQDADMDGKVGKLVTLGTPVLGATKALGVIEYKANCFTEEILDTHCITNPSTAQQVMRNFPSAYQLLPSRDFQDAVGSPLEIEGVDVSYDEWSGIVRSRRNGALFDAASTWQTQLAVRPHDPDVDMLRVVGSDRATPVQIERFTINDCFIFKAGFCPEKTVTKVIPGPGDGTVPRASAGLHDPDRSFDKTDGVDNHYVDGVSHMGLAQDSGVFDVLLGFLNGEAEARVASRVNLGVASQLINDDAPQFDGVAVNVIGPAWGTIRANDEMTGPVDGAEPDIIYEGISGSSLWRSGNTQTFVFSDQGSYTADFAVPDSGSSEYQYLEAQASPDDFIPNVILIEVDRYRDDVLDDSAIFRVEPTPGMRFEFDFATNGDPDDVTVLVDRDGDGEYETRATRVRNREPLPEPTVQTSTPTFTPTSTPSPTATATPTVTPSPSPTPTPRLVTRQLLRVGPNNELRPDLIAKWDIGGDQNQITLMLEEGVSGEDGRVLTSKALIDIIESHREDFIRYEYLGSEAIDDYTIFIPLGTSAAQEFLATIGVIQVAVFSG